MQDESSELAEPKSGRRKYVLVGTKGVGVTDTEVLTLSANVNFNLHALAIAVSIINGTKVSPHFRTGRRLPSWEVRAGDQIDLRTGHGDNRTESAGLVTRHVIHLGFNAPLFGTSRRALQIFEVGGWHTVGPMNQNGLGIRNELKRRR
jgi:hypothetical protein